MLYSLISANYKLVPTLLSLTDSEKDCIKFRNTTIWIGIRTANPVGIFVTHSYETETARWKRYFQWNFEELLYETMFRENSCGVCKTAVNLHYFLVCFAGFFVTDVSDNMTF